MMLTLTIDRDLYESPESAYRDIQKKRRVAECWRKMLRGGFVTNSTYTMTIEFHEDGWPHYHLLVQESFVDWWKLGDAWKIGHVHFSKRDFDDMRHAINYATKYIAKTDTEDGFSFPDWVLDYEGAIRRFSCSRGLLPPNRKPAKVNKAEPRPRITRTARKRVQNCGNQTKIIERVIKFVDVEVAGTVEVQKREHTKLVGVLDEPWADNENLSVDEICEKYRSQELSRSDYLVEGPDQVPYELENQHQHRRNSQWRAAKRGHAIAR